MDTNNDEVVIEGAEEVVIAEEVAQEEVAEGQAEETVQAEEETQA